LAVSYFEIKANFKNLILILFRSLAKTTQMKLVSAKQCERLHGLTLSQKRFCRNHFNFMNAIKRGAMMALDECQAQFKSRRWNCSTLASPNLFAKLPEYGLRESAFIYALASAALTHSITQACSDGKISGCSCDASLKGLTQDGYRWSGCSDNVGYGMGITEKFLDPRIKNKTNILLINIHNNEAGRQVVIIF
jgi:hypothetical protein